MISTTTSEIWKLDTDGFKVLAMFVLLVVEGTNGKDTGSENVDGEDDGDEHTETQIKLCWYQYRAGWHNLWDFRAA